MPVSRADVSETLDRLLEDGLYDGRLEDVEAVLGVLRDYLEVGDPDGPLNERFYVTSWQRGHPVPPPVAGERRVADQEDVLRDRVELWLARPNTPSCSPLVEDLWEEVQRLRRILHSTTGD